MSLKFEPLSTDKSKWPTPLVNLAMGMANMLRKWCNSDPRLLHFQNEAKFQQAVGTGGNQWTVSVWPASSLVHVVGSGGDSHSSHGTCVVSMSWYMWECNNLDVLDQGGTQTYHWFTPTPCRRGSLPYLIMSQIWRAWIIYDHVDLINDATLPPEFAAPVFSGFVCE